MSVRTRQHFSGPRRVHNNLAHVSTTTPLVLLAAFSVRE
jgi:hypothetical protein